MFNHGIKFVLHGLEQLKRDDEIMFAFSTLYTGVVLILKAKLEEEDWRLVVDKSQREKITSHMYEEGQCKTINNSDIKKKCNKAFPGLVDESWWNKFEVAKNYRNSIEHFRNLYTDEQMSLSCINLVHMTLDFVYKAWSPDEYEDDEIFEQVDQVQKVLKESFANYKKFFKEADKKLKKLSDKTVVKCPKCGCDYLVIEEGVKCLLCNYETEDCESAARLFFSRYSDYEEYEDGCTECPSCGDMDCFYNDGEGNYVCFACGGKWADCEIQRCTDCMRICGFVDDERPVCRECFERAMDRAD